MRKNSNIIGLAEDLLSTACEENRHRDAEVMQGIDGEKEHARVVSGWLEKLTKNPSVALRIAALFHDVDRIITPNVGGGFKGDRRSRKYQEHKKAHAKRGADYICPKLLEHGVDAQLVDRVEFLIVHHDDTGPEVESSQDGELNLIVAADSLAFFTSIAPRLYDEEGEERLKDKILFMIGKMPSFARELLSSQKLENDIFNRLKDEVLMEVRG